jgi:4-alpha-glucanotransferase
VSLAWSDRRRAGALLHITSLPGPQTTGVIGPEATAFIDLIAEAGFTVWQFLPLGPTHGHGSPYEALSSAAGNPDLIDLRQLVESGWLAEGRLATCIGNSESEAELRTEAATAFHDALASDEGLRSAFQYFQAAHAEWLDDFALFTAIKQARHDEPWWQWPAALRDREPHALEQAREQHAMRIRQVLFEQFIFDHQWQALKAHAEARGVRLFGDLPIYVAHDSADVWSARHYFTVNERGLCDEVAGVPPDYFSESGQRWGNPLYRWDVLEAHGFKWWIDRVRTQMERMHLMRIDHFRGLEAYWAIPGEREDGREGEWRPAPGAELLQAIRDELGELPVVAEDLGLITPEVHALRHRFGLPGMNILQFAFGGDAKNPYLPHNHELSSVTYTGTHDNDTTLGWYTSAPEHVRAHLHSYSGSDEAMPWLLIRMALESVAELAVIPVQDVLELGAEARFNTPSTLEDNWGWRMPAEAMHQEGWQHIAELNRLFGR